MQIAFKGPAKKSGISYLDFKINGLKRQRRNVKILFEHICIQVENLEAFIERCQSMEIDVLQVPKGDTRITFIKDGNGKLFEVKSA